MQIKDLKPNEKNPRKISKKRLEMLKASVAKYGDLSGFVFNRRSKRLVGAHQRTKILPEDAKIVIEVKHDVPTAAMTVAEGYVLVNGERHKFREVDADEVWEAEALLAANKHGGEWDKDVLKVVLSDKRVDFELAGFELPELKALDIQIAAPVIPSPSQEETDEQYVKNTPQTTEQIPVEQVPSTTNTDAFGGVQEKTEPDGKRYVIIIDCKGPEMKEALKEKLRPVVDEAGAKIF